MIKICGLQLLRAASALKGAEQDNKINKISQIILFMAFLMISDTYIVNSSYLEVKGTL